MLLAPSFPAQALNISPVLGYLHSSGRPMPSLRQLNMLIGVSLEMAEPVLYKKCIRGEQSSSSRLRFWRLSDALLLWIRFHQSKDPERYWQQTIGRVSDYAVEGFHFCASVGSRQPIFSAQRQHPSLEQTLRLEFVSSSRSYLCRRVKRILRQPSASTPT